MLNIENTCKINWKVQQDAADRLYAIGAIPEPVDVYMTDVEIKLARINDERKYSVSNEMA